MPQEEEDNHDHTEAEGISHREEGSNDDTKNK